MPRTLRRLLAALAAVSLALAGVLVGALPAQATMGVVEGFLHDATLAPGSDYIDNVVVELHDSTGYVDQVTTAGGGAFTFAVPDPLADYTIHVLDDPLYADPEVLAPLATDAATGGDLGDVELTRWATISGTIDNWNASMDPTEVLPEIWDPVSGFWVPAEAPFTTLTGSGAFSVPVGVTAGQYQLIFLPAPAADVFPTWLGNTFPGQPNVLSPFAVTIAAGPGDYPVSDVHMVEPVYLQGTVRSGATLLPLIDVSVLDLNFPFANFTSTGPGGTFSIGVVPGGTYQLYVQDIFSGLYYDQSYDGVNGCGCGYTPIVVPATASGTLTGYDFDLLEISQTIHLALYTEQEDPANPGSYLDYPGVTVSLYAGTSTTPIATVDSDSIGILDFFMSTPGDYRLRFGLGSPSRPIPVEEYYDYATSTSYTPAGDGCYVDLQSLALGDEVDIDLTFATTPDYTSCAPAATGGGGTPKKPVHRAPRSNETASFAASVLPTPTPTPTPTSTPSPSPSSSDEPSPSPSATVDPVPADNGAGLWWLWVILAVIVALILFFLVRLIVGRRP